MKVEEMELRDWFAGMALQGLSATCEWGPEACARLAYQSADEMLKQRDAKTNSEAGK